MGASLFALPVLSSGRFTSRAAGVSGRQIEAVLRDERNLVWLCAEHHNAVISGERALRYEDLPDETLELAQEQGLLEWVDRAYPPAHPFTI